MINKRLFFPSAYQQGIILLETLIAILIFSLGVLGAVGLQATMLKGTTEAKYRAEAGYIDKQRIGQIWVNAPVPVIGEPADLSGFVEEPPTDISAASGLPQGKRWTWLGAGNCAGELTCVTVKVTWQQPGGDEHNVMTVARITP